MRLLGVAALTGLACGMLLVVGCGGSRSPTSPTPSVLNVAGSWDVTFSGTIVQRNDGGPLGAPQRDTFVLLIQQSGTSLSGSLIFSEGRSDEFRVPLTGTLTGTRLAYRVETSIGGCFLNVQADTTVTATANSLSGTQTQSNCEGRAEGAVTGTKR